jgi:hypothetical protein
LWVDYADSISLHPVITTNRREHRLARLHSPLAEVRRITFGCINVPTAFYRDVVLNAFADGSGVVYILPEAKPLGEVLPAFAEAIGANAPSGGAGAPGSQQVVGSPQAAATANDAASDASAQQASGPSPVPAAANDGAGDPGAQPPSPAPITASGAAGDPGPQQVPGPLPASATPNDAPPAASDNQGARPGH